MKYNLSYIVQGEVVFTALMEGEPLHTIQDGFFPAILIILVLNRQTMNLPAQPMMVSDCPHWHSEQAGTTSHVRQPFCSQLEERLLLWLEYYPQVASYARGDIGTPLGSDVEGCNPLRTTNR